MLRTPHTPPTTPSSSSSSPSSSLQEEFFCLPDPVTTRNIKPHNYGKLSTSGFVDENVFVESGDVIVGKCMPQKAGSTIHNKDTSIALKSNERGFIDRNCHGDRYFTNVTGDGYTFAKVRFDDLFYFPNALPNAFPFPPLRTGADPQRARAYHRRQGVFATRVSISLSLNLFEPVA